MKPRLNYVEIYITNVCNYSCTHCQSLNNFAFKGHQLWDDYREDYTALSNKIDFDTIQIMGGEPTLNPNFEKWVFGISELWPSAKLQISTNGSQLDKITREIYQVLLKNKGTLWITCHNLQLYEDFLKFSKKFLDNIVSDMFSDNDSDYAWKYDYEQSRIDPTVKLKTVSRKLVDENGVEVILDWSQAFVPSAIDLIDEKTLKIKYNSDPVEAHNVCYFKTCHQLNKGKLYKCPLVSVLPDFLDQFNVDMSSDDRQLAYSYNPLSNGDNISKFIDTIKDPIPQCKFCPVNYTKQNFVGTDKKIKIIPIKQN